jgi:hypothetical protein
MRLVVNQLVETGILIFPESRILFEDPPQETKLPVNKLSLPFL